MNNDKKVIAVILGIVCIILFAVIHMQFRVVEKTDIAGLQSAREEELQTMISDLKTKYEEMGETLSETNSKILEYQEAINTSKESSDLLLEELQETNMLVGKTAVTGEGVIVTLEHNKEKSIVSSDLRNLVNELKLAGAEAISINDKRILNMSEITETSQHILVNEERITTPFVVKAIGDQTYLSSALSLKNSGFIDTTKNNGKTIQMRTDRNIEIGAYNSSKDLLHLRYAKEVEE